MGEGACPSRKQAGVAAHLLLRLPRGWPMVCSGKNWNMASLAIPARNAGSDFSSCDTSLGRQRLSY